MSVRRAVVIAIATSLLVTAGLPASARKPKQRVVESPYATPAVGVYTPVAWGWYFDCEVQVGCVLIEVQRGDRWLTIDIQDQSSLPVYAQLRNPSSGDVIRHIYGETTEPVLVGGPMTLTVHIIAGASPWAQPSAPTRGIVEATFTGR